MLYYATKGAGKPVLTKSLFKILAAHTCQVGTAAITPGAWRKYPCKYPWRMEEIPLEIPLQDGRNTPANIPGGWRKYPCRTGHIPWKYPWRMEEIPLDIPLGMEEIPLGMGRGGHVGA